MLDEILQTLRNLQPQAKNRLIVGVGALAALALGWNWLGGVGQQLGTVDSADILPGQVAGIETEGDKRIALENAVTKDGVTKIYFKVVNDSAGILSFSEKENVFLQIGNDRLEPTEMNDRRGGPFVRKVLGNSTAYGTITFPEQKKNSGTLVFDNLFLEDARDTVYRETHNYDLEELTPPAELRQ